MSRVLESSSKCLPLLKKRLGPLRDVLTSHRSHEVVAFPEEAPSPTMSGTSTLADDIGEDEHDRLKQSK